MPSSNALTTTASPGFGFCYNVPLFLISSFLFSAFLFIFLCFCWLFLGMLSFCIRLQIVFFLFVDLITETNFYEIAVTDGVVLLILTVEIVVKVIVFKPRRYLRTVSYRTEFIITMISYLGLLSYIPHLQILILFRIFRVLRLFRILKFSSKIKLILKSVWLVFSLSLLIHLLPISYCYRKGCPWAFLLTFRWF